MHEIDRRRRERNKIIIGIIGFRNIMNTAQKSNRPHPSGELELKHGDIVEKQKKY
jgi:hypothetical protein